MEQHNLYEGIPLKGVFYNAGLYLRLSKDDDLAGDSSSIQTQRLMLERYCKDNGYNVYDYYVDDGYSGTNFNSPDFIRLLDDIESGKINMVITKDLSRLGRDYIQTGYYTEVYFINKNVRYIAINDGFDTNNPENDIAPFKNILNDMYAKDISRKVKSAKKQRALKGYFISPVSPYGYLKNPEDKNKLIIDEEVADNVRLIFQLALEGKGCTRIAKDLTERRIKIPSTYKSEKGETTFNRFSEGKPESFHYTWNKMTVQAIMKDRVYTGDMVNHKFEVVSYKSDKLRRVPKDQLIVVPDTHESIISRDDFERVQQLMKARHSPRKYNHENIFKSILICKVCGRKLTQHVKSRKGDEVIMYKCQNHFNNPDQCPKHNFIRFDDLYVQVSLKLKQLFRTITDDDTFFELVESKKTFETKALKQKEEKAKFEKRLDSLSKLLRKVYEDYINGMLDTGNYQALLGEYQNEQKELKGKLQQLEIELGKEQDYLSSFGKLKEMVINYFDKKELTAEILNQMIERIEVAPVQKVNGCKEQEINLVYRFINDSI